jgi:hypothetical protein
VQVVTEACDSLSDPCTFGSVLAARNNPDGASAFGPVDFVVMKVYFANEDLGGGSVDAIRSDHRIADYAAS